MLLLAACCCLLLLAAAAAKPGRSTLDTKKGYKTKTGSTSSVTLTLTITQLPPPPPHPWLDTPLTPGQTPPPTPGLTPPPDPRLDPPQLPPPPPPPLQVLTDSWGGVASGPVVVAPPGTDRSDSPLALCGGMGGPEASGSFVCRCFRRRGRVLQSPRNDWAGH